MGESWIGSGEMVLRLVCIIVGGVRCERAEREVASKVDTDVDGAVGSTDVLEAESKDEVDKTGTITGFGRENAQVEGRVVVEVEGKARVRRELDVRTEAVVVVAMVLEVRGAEAQAEAEAEVEVELGLVVDTAAVVSGGRLNSHLPSV